MLFYHQPIRQYTCYHQHIHMFHNHFSNYFCSYQGSWKNDLRNGHGTYEWADGNKYVGEFVDGKREG